MSPSISADQKALASMFELIAERGRKIRMSKGNINHSSHHPVEKISSVGTLLEQEIITELEISDGSRF